MYEQRNFIFKRNPDFNFPEEKTVQSSDGRVRRKALFGEEEEDDDEDDDDNDDDDEDEDMEDSEDDTPVKSNKKLSTKDKFNSKQNKVMKRFLKSVLYNTD